MSAKPTRHICRPLLVIIALLAGCGDDHSGTPQPVPIPGQLRLSQAVPIEPEPVTVVGLPGAVAGAGRVFLQVDGRVVEVRSAESGSFYAIVQARGGQTLSIRYEDSEAASKVVETRVGIQTPPPPKPISGVPPIELSAGQATIRGQASTGDIGIIGVNQQSGVVVTTTAQPDGKFTLSIAASSGETITVYHDDTPFGAEWRLTAP
jgi:hypothetical protein